MLQLILLLNLSFCKRSNYNFKHLNTNTFYAAQLIRSHPLLNCSLLSDIEQSQQHKKASINNVAYTSRPLFSDDSKHEFIELFGSSKTQIELAIDTFCFSVTAFSEPSYKSPFQDEVVFPCIL